MYLPVLSGVISRGLTTGLLCPLTSLRDLDTRLSKNSHCRVTRNLRVLPMHHDLLVTVLIIEASHFVHPFLCMVIKIIIHFFFTYSTLNTLPFQERRIIWTVLVVNMSFYLPKPLNQASVSCYALVIGNGKSQNIPIRYNYTVFFSSCQASI